MMKRRRQEAEEILEENFSGESAESEESAESGESEEGEDLWVAGKLSLEEVLLEEGLSIYSIVLRPNGPGSPVGAFPPYPFL